MLYKNIRKNGILLILILVSFSVIAALTQTVSAATLYTVEIKGTAIVSYDAWDGPNQVQEFASEFQCRSSGGSWRSTVESNHWDKPDDTQNTPDSWIWSDKDIHNDRMVDEIKTKTTGCYDKSTSDVRYKVIEDDYVLGEQNVVGWHYLYFSSYTCGTEYWITNYENGEGHVDNTFQISFKMTNC